MSKAEEFAYSKYPKEKKGVLYDLARNSIIEGYHQAEKDLELTCEDLELLQDISREVFVEVGNGDVDYYQIYPTRQSFFEEVLKRFKNMKDGSIM